MARWIQDIPIEDPDLLGYTVVASWWPGRFHSAMTMLVRVASATEGISVLTRKLHEIAPDQLGPPRDYFVTLVHKTDRMGVQKSQGPEYEIEYADEEAALLGHAQVVAALAQGGGSLRHLVKEKRTLA